VTNYEKLVHVFTASTGRHLRGSCAVSTADTHAAPVPAS
jgi:hypothetical protein